MAVRIPSTLTEDERLVVFERAAIMEFDGHMERSEAERKALEDFRRGHWQEGWDD